MDVTAKTDYLIKMFHIYDSSEKALDLFLRNSSYAVTNVRMKEVVQVAMM